MRTARLAAPLVILAIALAACGAPAPAADSPEGIVRQALDRAAAKDLDGLRGLACAGQEDLVRDQLSLQGLVPGADLIAGIDMQAVLDAVSIDATEVEIGSAATQGEVAEVPVSGSVKVTFDAEAMRPILRQVLEAQGSTMTDTQIDALLITLENYGQDVPVDQTLRLVRENGAWRICQESIEAPAAS